MKYDLVEIIIDFEVLTSNIEFELKDNPIKLYTYKCDSIDIISDDDIINKNLETIT